MEIVYYLAIVLFSPLQSAASKYYAKDGGDILSFNLIKSFSALALFALVSIWGITFHVDTIVLSAFYGISLAVSMHFGYRAVEVGPMALTSLLVSFSVVIPIVYGLSFCGEAFTFFKGLGFGFLFVAIICSNIKKRDNVSSKTDLRWFLCVLLTFVTNGICAVLQKRHQILYPKLYGTEFMLFAMLTCFLIYAVFAIIKIRPTRFFAVKKKRYGVYSGVGNGIANFCTILLAGFESASVLFPTISIGTIIGAIICGRVLFKEKLNVNNYLTLLFGVVAIIFLKL